MTDKELTIELETGITKKIRIGDTWYSEKDAKWIAITILHWLEGDLDENSSR